MYNRLGNFGLASGHNWCLGSKSQPNYLKFSLYITNLISYWVILGLFIKSKLTTDEVIRKLVFLDFLKEQPTIVRKLVSEVFPKPGSCGIEMRLIKSSCVNVVIRKLLEPI